MKKFIFLFVFLVSSLLLAQTKAPFPKGFNYKALLTDNGIALNNQPVNIRFTILEGGTTNVYQETQTANTDNNGVVSVSIGEGTTTDNFNAISWGEHKYALKVEIDTGNGYSDMGTSDLKYVPFAKFADKARVADYVTNSFWQEISNAINSSNPVGIGISNATEANLHINDVTGGLPLIKMESNDNIYTIWKSNRAGVDDYLIGIDGGNNKFQFANTTTGDFPLTLQGAKVGVNNINPTANLDVIGSFKLVNGTQGDGKVLTSDANGNASWQTPSVSKQTDSILYSPLTVQPRRNSSSFVRTTKEFYVDEISGNACAIPLELPAGAKITKIVYYYYDNSSSDIHFSLHFSKVTTGTESSFFSTIFTSSGTNTNVQSKTINFEYTIDDIHNYGFVISLTNGLWPGDNTLSIRGIKVVYTK